MMMLPGWFLNRLIRIGTLTVIDAGGRIHRFGGGEPTITVQLHDPKLTRGLFFQPELAAGAAYMDGTLTIENVTLYDFLDLIGRNYAHGGFSGLDGPFDRFRHPLHWFSSFNSRRRSRKNAVHHYNLSGALYDLFLDRQRHYSCAYFIDESDSLEEAQQQKCRHIAAKLLLKPGMRVLDIGSGWGGMALYLAKRFGAEVVGITLSDEQLKVAQQRAQKAQVGLRACFFLRDYREEGSYDRIVSGGMFEHVGPIPYKNFFRVLRDRLVDNGVALLHTIGQLDPPRPTSPWVRKYIFPGRHIPGFLEVAPAIERAGLLVTDVEVLPLHYAETLRHWRQRFLANRERAKALYDERFCRMWEFYLASSEMAFRYMKLCVFQIQLAKRIDAVPLTRDYMVDAERELAAGERHKRSA